MLCHRYDNKKSVIEMHLQDLVALMKLKNECGFPKLLNDTKKTVRILKTFIASDKGVTI